VAIRPTGEPGGARTPTRDRRSLPVQHVPVANIRPEEGLGRKRDRHGHRELQRSIEQFGVLTPITVRLAPDGSGDYLLIKGQGRTLACRLLGLEAVPAIVVDDAYAEAEKVQQFLVENVARLKMRPVDRALLIQRARQDGEETAAIASRFGVSASTVRRLFTQLDGVTSHEVKALEAGEVSLGMHAVIARHVDPSDRAAVLGVMSGLKLKPKEVEALFVALGWRQLTELGSKQFGHRIALFHWACNTLAALQSGTLKERLGRLAMEFPTALRKNGDSYSVAAQ
jgi:ParB/RepB/Spo0J family partition protein